MHAGIHFLLDAIQKLVCIYRLVKMTRFYVLYPPSQKILSEVEGMNAKCFLLRRDFAPDEAARRRSPGFQPGELHQPHVTSYRSIRIDLSVKASTEVGVLMACNP